MAALSSNESPPWADLPKEMVDEVVGHLDIFSTAQLTAVCTSWAKAVATNTSLPFGRPCLLMSREDDDQQEAGPISGEDDECTFGLLDLSGTWKEITTFPAFVRGVRDRWWVGAKGDWLATVDEHCNAQLVNPYSGDRIDLPAITTISGVELTGRCCEVQRGHSGYWHTLCRIVICETPSGAGNNGDYLVIGVFTGALLAIVRGGDHSWTALKNPRETWFGYCDAIVHKGKVFGVGSNGYLYAWDLRAGSCLEPEMVPLPQVNHDKYPLNLAESADGRRLLLVYTIDWIYKLNCNLSREIDRFDDHGLHLYELDVDAAGSDGDGWSRVTSLGDSALFLGANYPFLASVDSGSSENLLRPNCVYFAMNELFGYLGMYFDLVVFDLDNQKYQQFRLFYSNRYYNFQAPIWFRPTTKKCQRSI